MSVGYEYIYKKINPNFARNVLLSELDIIASKRRLYDKKAKESSKLESYLNQRLEMQIKEDKNLPLGGRGISATEDIIKQRDALVLERSLYTSLIDILNARFFKIIMNDTAIRKLGRLDVRDPSNRNVVISALDPNEVVLTQQRLKEAVRLVETGITGDARLQIREYLYGVLATFAKNPHGYIDSMELNFVIKGPPGTGKTRIAKVMSMYFYKIGLLARDVYFVHNKASLVAQYTGQSAGKTRAAIFSALEGVFFLDEAYSVLNCEGDGKKITKRDQFGLEAINQFVDTMTQVQGLIVFIVAGYKQDMEICFLESNPGLSRRFVQKWTLEPFTARDLLLIFQNNIISTDKGSRVMFKYSNRVFSKKAKLVDMINTMYPIIFKLNELGVFTAQASDMGRLSNTIYKTYVLFDNNPTLKNIIDAVNTYVFDEKGIDDIKISTITESGEVIMSLKK